MFRIYRRIAVLIICLTIFLSVLLPYSQNSAFAAHGNVSIVHDSSYSDNPSTVFTYNTLGKNKRKTAVKINSNHYSEAYITYHITAGEAYQFYVVSAWVKTEDYKLQKNSGYGISIMVDDPSDHNSSYVYSDMIHKNTDEIPGDDRGWVKLRRVVKLDSQGKLTFQLRTGWSKNKMKGTVLFDQIKVTPIKEDKKYLLYTSTDGTIRMVFRKADVVRSGISSQKISDWLDVYAKLRQSMKWLIGNSEPYEGTTDFILTEKLTHYGLAGNPIYINCAEVSNELSKIELDATADHNNLLWGLVHEMGHTFDGVASNKLDLRWVFDDEFFATLKCVYSFYDNGYGFGGNSFVGEEVYLNFSKALSLSSGVYNYEGFMFQLLEIMNTLDSNGGWVALQKTFISFKELPMEDVPKTNIDRFMLFIKLLSENSGLEIEKQFTPKEWKVLINKFTYDGLNYQIID